MTLRRKLDPAELPVSFEWARRRSRILESVAEEEREDIEFMIQAGTDLAEKIMGRAIVRQVWEKRLDAFPDNGGAIELAMPPVMSVDLVTYIDDDAAPQTLSPACYEVDPQSETAWLVPAYGYVWPVALDKVNAITVEFTAGWAAPGVVPAAIRDAILLYVAHRYENREAVVVYARGAAIEVPLGFESLLEPYRVLRFA